MLKKKFVMRVASLALCVVFTGMLFGAPKSKAVAIETAIGVAAIGAYFAATGLVLSASDGSTGDLVTTGIGQIVTDFCAAADYAGQTATDFYVNLANNTSIRPDGTLALTAAAVVAIGALVAWYVSENELEEGSTAIVFPGTSDRYSYNGVELSDINSVWCNYSSLSYAFIVSVGSYYQLYLSDNNNWTVDSSGLWTPSGSVSFVRFNSPSWSSGTSFSYSSRVLWDGDVKSVIWSNFDFYERSGNVVLSPTAPIPVGNVQNQLDVTRVPDFFQPDYELDSESKKQMVIDLGFSPGISLDTVVEQVPDLIAAGSLAPTYEITSTETGEGTVPDEGIDSDDLVYVPMLERIQNAITGLGNTIVDGIMDGLKSLFVPSEAYLEALPQQVTDTFEERTGFLTYPFSVLPEFVDRLSATSTDWILRWPQIVEPFSNTVLFEPGSFNVSSFMRNNAQFSMLYDLYRLLMKVFMSFCFLGLCYNKYRSVVGDHYGGD